MKTTLLSISDSNQGPMQPRSLRQLRAQALLKNRDSKDSGSTSSTTWESIWSSLVWTALFACCQAAASFVLCFCLRSALWRKPKQFLLDSLSRSISSLLAPCKPSWKSFLQAIERTVHPSSWDGENFLLLMLSLLILPKRFAMVPEKTASTTAETVANWCWTTTVPSASNATTER